MKTLINEKVVLSADGKSVTIIADVVDQPFSGLLVTRVSHHHVNPDNIKHPRRIQSSNEAVFMEAPGTKAAIPNKFIAAIFAAIEPKTTFAPIFKKTSVPGDVQIISETPVTYQWQVSDDAFPKATADRTPPPPAVWADISGEINPKTDLASVKLGQWIRCVASNASGKTISKPAQKK
jgi:hypothetical protein